MSFLQQFSARPWAVALSHCCTCRIGMAPTQYLNVKCGGFTVSRGHFRNISNVVCIPHYHFPLNSITYSIKHFTPLFRKQKLSCLQHCFRTYSKSLMLYDSESDGYRNGGDLFPPVRKVLEELNIIRRSHLPGQYSKLLCPQCQGGSTRERSLSLYIGEDGVSAKWMCHRAKCGWSGGTKDGKLFLALENATSNVEATYAISNVEVADVISNVEVLARKDFTVENMQLEQISAEHLCCYFTSRRISGKTLQRNGVMQTTRNNKIFIAFTYRRNGKIVNCKYRDVEKRFFQEKHGEKIPYGLDDIKEARDIIIVEGEMDKLAMEEAGYRNCISVPDGAPPKVSTKELPPVEQDKKYQYLWNSKEYFEQASRIILATDADTAGQALAEELARRLGRERCWRVTWPRRSETTKELCKDANEVLIYFGQQALKEVIEGADLIDAYNNRQLGTELGVSTGWVGLDELYRLVSESVKAKEVQNPLLMEKQDMAKQLQEAGSSAEMYKQKIMRLEEQVRVYLDQIGKVTEDGWQYALNLDSTKRKLVDVEKESQSLKASLEAVQKESEQCKHRITDLQVELKNERFGKKRIEEELVALNTKFTCLSSLNDGETAAERLQEEIKEYKAILKCSVCHDRPKEVVITKCFHLFCGPCIQRNLETRHRKCPGCGTGFGQNDVRTVYI